MDDLLSGFHALLEEVNGKVQYQKDKAMEDIQQVYMQLLELQDQKQNEYLLIAMKLVALIKVKFFQHLEMKEFTERELRRLKCKSFFHKNVKIFALLGQLETKTKLKVVDCFDDIPQLTNYQQLIEQSIHKDLTQHKEYIVNAMEWQHMYTTQNAFLSQHYQLQTQLNQDSKARVKGLFCIIDEASLWNILAYGFGIVSTSSSKAHIEFQQPWFLKEYGTLSANQPNKTSGYSVQSWVDAVRLKLDNIPFSKSSVSPSTVARFHQQRQVEHLARLEREIVRDGEDNNAATAATTTAVSMKSYCLMLCRVYLRRVCTVLDDVRPQDIEKARQKGYDAIFSQQREEYTLLNGSFVLPELFTFVSPTELVPDTEAMTMLERRASDLVDSLIPPSIQQLLQDTHSNKSVLLDARKLLHTADISTNASLPTVKKQVFAQIESVTHEFVRQQQEIVRKQCRS